MSSTHIYPVKKHIGNKSPTKVDDVSFASLDSSHHYVVWKIKPTPLLSKKPNS